MLLSRPNKLQISHEISHILRNCFSQLLLTDRVNFILKIVEIENLETHIRKIRNVY